MAGHPRPKRRSAFCGDRPPRPLRQSRLRRPGARPDEEHTPVMRTVAAIFRANVSLNAEMIAKAPRLPAMRPTRPVGARRLRDSLARAVVGALDEKRASVILRRPQLGRARLPLAVLDRLRLAAQSVLDRHPRPETFISAPLPDKLGRRRTCPDPVVEGRLTPACASSKCFSDKAACRRRLRPSNTGRS